MNFSLTLDDDVAILLERARRERGESLERLGNSLLRRILERENAYMRSAGFKSISSGTPQPAVPKAGQQSDSVSIEAQIDQLYGEIRDLVARSADNPGLTAEIECKRTQLESLQAEEAAAWRQRAEARRHLKPGEGYRILERAANLLES